MTEESTRRFQILIDGQWRDPASGLWMPSVNPATEEVWCEIPNCQEDDVNDAVMAAHRAFHGPWSTTSPVERGRVLTSLAEALPDNAARLAELEVSDSGKNLTESTNFMKFCAGFFKFYGEMADKVTGSTFSNPFPGMQTYTHRVPVGVVAAVIPWNNPLWLLSMKLGPALATGNTVVIKPSELCATPIIEIVRLMHDVADIPPGVINIVTGEGDPCGRVLTSHEKVSKVAFTGGPITARHIVANTAKNLAETTLELGGKSPVIVFDDADMDNAIQNVIAGVFAGSSGQSCVAGSRALVQRPVYDEFVRRLVEAAEGLKVGDPRNADSQMGPLATLAQVERCESAVAEAVESGAVVKTGGKRPEYLQTGYYFEPTILTIQNQDIAIAHTELFGPVIVVMPFDDEAEAIELANDTEFGLAAGFFTTNLGRAMRLTKAVRAGIQWINTYRLGAPNAPIGGFGESGQSREGGMDAINEYTKPVTVWINTNV
ncbi:MAG: acyl-CoA reductase-like NAD-dependent aldehyde dehydrogenase [Parasphingorhabdus sp.]|jgi:acyl-CoA reductase-like NAD-dependent aldehyde dehydrogenase